MGIFDFKNSKQPSIDLSDFKFLSDDHTRIEKGNPVNANNKGALRGIRIRTADNKTFYVTIYNMIGNHPLWGDNIQMSEKRMKLIEETADRIIFRGYGTDAMGGSFANYGITLYKSKLGIDKIALHLLDRKIDIVYSKEEEKPLTETITQISDFDDFVGFAHKWNNTMSSDEKYQIALETDQLFNQGIIFFDAGDMKTAIEYFQGALVVMPINDDALKILANYYAQMGDNKKSVAIKMKLDYLSSLY
jgi:hypothetical protein